MQINIFNIFGRFLGWLHYNVEEREETFIQLKDKVEAFFFKKLSILVVYEMNQNW